MASFIIHRKSGRHRLTYKDAVKRDLAGFSIPLCFWEMMAAYHEA